MKALLQHILENIVDSPEEITISESTDETGLTTFNVTVAEADMGKVIGKGGKVINSIRQIIKIKSLKLGKRVNINLQEPEGSSQAQPAETPAGTPSAATAATDAPSSPAEEVVSPEPMLESDNTPEIQLEPEPKTEAPPEEPKA